MPRYDVGVIGLGAMGSAVLAECVKRGMRAIGFEQFAAGNDFGSSSGRSRMIRKAYYEHPSYVPLVLRAYDAWRRLERYSSRALLHITGLLMIGQRSSELLAGALRSARHYDLAVEELYVREVRERFPMFAIGENERALYESDAGFVVPEAAIEAFLECAARDGAHMRFQERAALDQVLEQASRVVVCAGAWLEEFDLGIPVRVERNVQHWFTPRDGRFAIGRCPAFLIDRRDYPYPLYGFPDDGSGCKVAFHGSGDITRAGALDRHVRQSEVAAVRAALDRALPGLAARHVESKVCMYALTPDRHFALGVHPRESRVIVAGGFSGHGFKFAPVVAEYVADLVAGSAPRHEIEFLSLTRFLPAAEHKEGDRRQLQRDRENDQRLNGTIDQ